MLLNIKGGFRAPAILSVAVVCGALLTMCGCSDTSGCGLNVPDGSGAGDCCGNGVVEAPEECDDGNTYDADGCSNACKKIVNNVSICLTDPGVQPCPVHCSDSPDCGHGQCMDTTEGYECVCDDGYLGERCSGRCLLTAGQDFTVALNYTGSVVAWGSNHSGQMADMSDGPVKPSILISEVSGSIRQIDAAPTGSHILARGAGKEIWAWGRDNEGQLGKTKTSKDEVVVYKSPSGVAPTWISAGRSHSLGIFETNIETWGLSDPVMQNLAFTEAAACDGFNLAISYGKAYSWGQNALYGQLGTGDTNPRAEPTKLTIPTIKAIIDVACGLGHSLALDDDGRVWAWGWNKTKQLGDVVEDFKSTAPIELSFEDEESEPNEKVKIIAIAAGSLHSVALDDTGHVWTWGDHTYGQLGYVTSDPQAPAKPRRAKKNPDDMLDNIVLIDAGGFFTLAMDGYGVLWAWGDNSEGQLGLKDETADTNYAHKSLFACSEEYIE